MLRLSLSNAAHSALCCRALGPLISVISLKLCFTATWQSCHIHTQRGVVQEANDGCVIWWDRHCHAAHAARFQLKLPIFRDIICEHWLVLHAI